MKLICKAFLSIAFLFLFTLTFSTSASATCTKIQSGLITDAVGNPITVGFDKWGYNYQAHMFNGIYGNFTRPSTVLTEGPVRLEMKWSDDWLSNQDCFVDTGGSLGGQPNKLDRGGDGSGISKGWLTNHEEGDYTVGDDSFHYTYFVKIVYDSGAACTAGNSSCIWGSYSIIEEVYNDPGSAAPSHGVNRSSLVNPAGLGFYTN